MAYKALEEGTGYIFIIKERRALYDSILGLCNLYFGHSSGQCSSGWFYLESLSIFLLGGIYESSCNYEK